MASTIQIKRGTGSAVPSGLADGELAINLDNRRLYFGSGSTSVNDFSFGEITAEKYIVSSSVLYVTTSFSSGSTEFGDTADDTHTFTGNITSSGNISASGDISSSGIFTVGNASIGASLFASRVFPNGPSGPSIDQVNNDISISTGLKVTTHITASGNVSASGTIIASNLSGTNTGDQDLSSYSTITQLNASSSTLQTNIDTKAPIANPSFTGNITASGDISASLNSKLYASSASFGGAAFLRSFNVKGAGLEGRLSLQGASTDDNPGIEMTVNDNTSRVLMRLNPIGSNGTELAIFTEPDGGNIAEAITVESNGNLELNSHDIKGVSNITASGNISASGTVFTDTISSPTNNLIISSSTVKITATTDGEANLILESDSDNNDENDNPFMLFTQDGGGIEGMIGLTGDAGTWPDGTTLTGATANAMVIGMTGSASSTNRQLFLVAGNTIGLTILNDGKVGIGVTDPDEALEVVGDIKLSGDIHANGNIIGDGATQITGIDKIAGTTDNILEITSDSDIIYTTDDDNDEAGEHIFKERVTTLLTLAPASASFAVPVKDGGRTIVKILPTDFVANDGGRPVQIEDDSIGSNELFAFSHSDFDMYAYIEIPYGMTATHAKIFGSNTGENFTVYEADITNKTIAAKCSATAIESEADITDVPWTDSNYLVILITSAGATDEIHGGYVKIEPS